MVVFDPQINPSDGILLKSPVGETRDKASEVSLIVPE